MDGAVARLAFEEPKHVDGSPALNGAIEGWKQPQQGAQLRGGAAQC